MYDKTRTRVSTPFLVRGVDIKDDVVSIACAYPLFFSQMISVGYFRGSCPHMIDVRPSFTPSEPDVRDARRYNCV